MAKIDPWGFDRGLRVDFELTDEHKTRSGRLGAWTPPSGCERRPGSALICGCDDADDVDDRAQKRDDSIDDDELPVVARLRAERAGRDARLTQLRQQQDRILVALTELDVTAPKLTAAERRTVRDWLVAVRRRIDASVVQFGGRHKELPS